MLSSCLKSEENMNTLAEIYYVPIGVETYVPMTIENIEQHYARHSKLSVDSKAFKKLISTLEISDDGIFDFTKVRVKIILPNKETIFIDNSGALSSKYSNRKIDNNALEKVKNILEDVTEVRKRE